MEEITAYHEAGHAFAAVYVGAEVDFISIAPDPDDEPDRYGETRVLWNHALFSQEELARKQIMVALAGPVAEMIHSGDPWHPGLVPEWAPDWNTAWTVAEPIAGGDKKRLALLEQISIQLYHVFLRDNIWPAIAALVDELLAHDELEGDTVHEIVEQWLRLAQ